MGTDNLVASIFMMWSDILWPRSRSNGLLRLGALDMSVESFDLMLLGEFFRWNRPVFREFMKTGGFVWAYTPYHSLKYALTIDGKKVDRHFYVYNRGSDAHDDSACMDLYAEMSATEDTDGTVRINHAWPSVHLYCRERERCNG